MIKRFTSPAQRKGHIGEKIAQKYLKSKGFGIIDINVSIGHNEIDCIGLKDNVLYFIEIKTTFGNFDAGYNVSREKIRKMTLSSNEYIEKNDVSYETQLAFVLVNVSYETRIAKVRFMGNIILD